MWLLKEDLAVYFLPISLYALDKLADRNLFLEKAQMLM